MKIKANILLFILAPIFLQSCNGNMNKQNSGVLIGSVAGGLLGSQFGGGGGALIATGIGAVAGALVGSSIGQSMDEQDKLMIEKSSKQALEFAPSGNSIQWKNPDNGNRGSITPVKTFKEHGHYCREYIQEVYIGGEKHKAYGRACRQEDGNWKIIQ